MVRERKCLMNGKATGAQIKALQTAEREDDKCVNCKASHPKYICLEFLTFVCQECSNIHRGFGHRIAAIDHSEWTAEEYAEIEKGGNKLASEEFLAFWNQTDFPRPEKKDKERLRDFIRKAYVVKCWQRQPDPKRPRKPWGSLASKSPAAGGETKDAPASTAVPSAPTQQPTAPAPAPAVEAPAQAAPAEAPAAAAGGAGVPATAAPAPAAAPAAGAAPGEPAAPAAPPAAGGGLVYLAKDSACFCPNHDTTEKRTKTEPSFKTCNGCKLVLQTNYSWFAYCPGCSAERSLCMICGTTVVQVSKYGPDGMPVESVRKCASRECSDGTDEATSAGNPDGRCEVDFSSSDAEGAELGGGPAPAVAPAATAPAQAAGCIGNLMDLDVLEAAAPGSGAAAPTVAEPFPGAVPVQKASPSDWLGEAIVSEPSATAGEVSASDDWLGAAIPSTSAPAVPAVASTDGAAAPAPDAAAAAAPEQQRAEVSASDDWFGAAIPSTSAPAAPAAASTDGEPSPATGGQCEDWQPAWEPQEQAATTVDPFAGLDASPCTAGAVEAKPAARELLLETPKRNTGDALGFEKQQAMNFFCGSPAPAPMPGSSPVQDRFAALGELPLPGQRPPAGPSPSQLSFGAGLMQMGSPMPSRGTAEAMGSPQAMMTPQRLDDVSADDLSKMHAMVTQALQQRSQAGSVNASPMGSPCPHQMSPMMGGACNTPWSGVPEPPQLQFGDVLSALHEKQHASEERQSATPAKAFEAFDSALMSTVTEPEEPKEFGDLLAAFHKKNPIAGFNSLA